MIKIKAEAFLYWSLFQYVAKKKTLEKQQKESYIQTCTGLGRCIRYLRTRPFEFYSSSIPIRQCLEHNHLISAC